MGRLARATAAAAANVVCLVLIHIGKTDCFISSHRPWTPSLEKNRVCLEMAFTPVGPFCPFRSSKADQMDAQLDELQSKMKIESDFREELVDIQGAIEGGSDPGQGRLLHAASKMDFIVEDWEKAFSALHLSPDYQTREFILFSSAQMVNMGSDLLVAAKLMKWQAGCLRALAWNTPPPLPPSDIDLEQFLTRSERRPPVPSFDVGSIKEPPFLKDALAESELIAREHAQLCADHAGLIELGANYDTFDQSGKLSYIDEIERIEERWDILYARFGLMGKLNKGFSKKCTEFLSCMQMNEQDYRELLKQTHNAMREAARLE